MVFKRVLQTCNKKLSLSCVNPPFRDFTQPRLHLFLHVDEFPIGGRALYLEGILVALAALALVPARLEPAAQNRHALKLRKKNKKKTILFY